MYLAAGDGESVKLFTADTFALIKSLDGNGSHVDCLTFSSDDQSLAVGTQTTGLVIWNLTSDMLPSSCKRLHHTCYFRTLCFNRSNDRLLSQDGDGYIMNWDLSTQNSLYTVKTNSWLIYAECLFCNGDQQFVSMAVVDEDEDRKKLLLLWNAETGAVEKRFETINGIHGIDLSPDSYSLAVVRGDDSIVILDLLQDVKTCEIVVPREQSFAVCRYVDSAQLATSDSMGTAIWDLSTQSLVASFSWATTLNMSVHGGCRRIAMDAVDDVLVVDLDSGEVVWKLDGARGVAFSKAVTILM
jgi:WD40 repeat protein